MCIDVNKLYGLLIKSDDFLPDGIQNFSRIPIIINYHVDFCHLCLGPKHNPEAEFLNVICSKSSEFSSLLHTVTYSQSPLLILPPPPHPLEQKWVEISLLCKTLYKETSSLRILKIMPRNLNEILRS